MLDRLSAARLVVVIAACTSATCASRPTTDTMPSPQPRERAQGASPAGAFRADRALTAMRSSGVLGACWQAIVERTPTHAPERATITITVDAEGRITGVDVDQVCDRELRACFLQRVSSVRIEPGMPIDAQAHFNLAIEGDSRAAQPCAERATTRDVYTQDAAASR